MNHPCYVILSAIRYRRIVATRTAQALCAAARAVQCQRGRGIDGVPRGRFPGGLPWIGPVSYCHTLASLCRAALLGFRPIQDCYSPFVAARFSIQLSKNLELDHPDPVIVIPGMAALGVEGIPPFAKYAHRCRAPSFDWRRKTVVAATLSECITGTYVL